jgi:hypothetical protein
LMAKKSFPEVLLGLEWTCSAESGKVLNQLGFARRSRPVESAARLEAFIPWLGIEFVCETAAPLGLKPVPSGDEPVPQLYRGFGWFLLSFVVCLWKRLLEDNIRVDLQDMCIRALTLLYMECPEEVQGVEGSTVLNRFSQELFPSPQFKAYLEQLETAVEAYVVVRALEPNPADRRKVVEAASSLLRHLLNALEVKQS